MDFSINSNINCAYIYWDNNPNKPGIKDFYERFKERIALDDNPSEKLIIAIIGICTLFAVGDYLWSMWIKQTVSLADLFMLFIFAEVVAMIGAFYSTERIPLRCPQLLVITALCRLIIPHSKDMDATLLIAEAGGILILQRRLM